MTRHVSSQFPLKRVIFASPVFPIEPDWPRYMLIRFGKKQRVYAVITAFDFGDAGLTEESPDLNTKEPKLLWHSGINVLAGQEPAWIGFLSFHIPVATPFRWLCHHKSIGQEIRRHQPDVCYGWLILSRPFIENEGCWPLQWPLIGKPGQMRRMDGWRDSGPVAERSHSAHIPAAAAGIDQSARFTPEHALHLYFGTAPTKLTPPVRRAQMKRNLRFVRLIIERTAMSCDMRWQHRSQL
jgi:hypothetical protein